MFFVHSHAIVDLRTTKFGFFASDKGANGVEDLIEDTADLE